MSMVAVLLALAGFAALALAMPRHYQAVLRRQQSRNARIGLRLVGWGMIAASLAASVFWLGDPVGIVAWFGVLNAGALAVALCLTLGRKRAK